MSDFHGNYEGPRVGCWCVSMLQRVSMRCCVLRCVVVCCSVLQCVAVCCSVLQGIAVFCSVLQCVAATYMSYLTMQTVTMV